MNSGDPDSGSASGDRPDASGYQYAAVEWIPGVGTYEGVTVD